MSKMIDLTGKTFGSWRVIEKADAPNGQRRWKCVCACGTEKFVVGQTLRTGASVSCGCRKPEAIRVSRTKHGHASFGKDSRTYEIWSGMKARCFNPKHIGAKYYSERGISVCERWMSFENFLADMGEAPVGLTIERMDNDRGYEPANCKWATYHEQRMNQRRMVEKRS